MSDDITFYCGGPYGSKTTYPTFADAERLARKRFAAGKLADIYALHGLDRTGANRTRLGAIQRSSDGKLWTDLTWEGSRFA